MDRGIARVLKELVVVYSKTEHAPQLQKSVSANQDLLSQGVEIGLDTIDKLSIVFFGSHLLLETVAKSARFLLRFFAICIDRHHEVILVLPSFNSPTVVIGLRQSLDTILEDVIRFLDRICIFTFPLILIGNETSFKSTEVRFLIKIVVQPCRTAHRLICHALVISHETSTDLVLLGLHKTRWSICWVLVFQIWRLR